MENDMSFYEFKKFVTVWIEAFESSSQDMNYQFMYNKLNNLQYRVEILENEVTKN
ncbi:MAG: hypothetical protein ACI9CE_000204 [Flavobacterium sp.]|jgi:hypothetical protein